MDGLAKIKIDSHWVICVPVGRTKALYTDGNDVVEATDRAIRDDEDDPMWESRALVIHEDFAALQSMPAGDGELAFFFTEDDLSLAKFGHRVETRRDICVEGMRMLSLLPIPFKMSHWQ